ncbi:MAG: hypothetical protein ACOC3Z_03100 [Nanoarchaeota archaeon]
MADLVVSRIIKIVLVVLLIVVVLFGFSIKMSGSFFDFFKNLPGNEEVIKPLSCEEYCSVECSEKECNEINNQWKEYYDKKGLEVKDKCSYENGDCVSIN